MTQPTLKAIIESCLDMESMAADLYQAFAAASSGGEQTLWRGMAADELRHAGYWKELVGLADEGELRNYFDRPADVLAELQALRKKARGVVDRSDAVRDQRERLRMASQLEFFMLNPAFAVLFHFMKDKVGGISPEDDYNEHLGKFAAAFREISEVCPESELLADMISMMWELSRDNARRLAEIKTLGGLIPICAECKKIRNDKGFWEQLEAYISKHTDAEFTHGLCPDCLAKTVAEYEKVNEKRGRKGPKHGKQG